MSLTLVDASVRKPVFHRSYWAKVDGVRKMLTLHEIEYHLERDCKVEWVEEESDKFVAAKQKGEPYYFKQDDSEPESGPICSAPRAFSASATVVKKEDLVANVITTIEVDAHKIVPTDKPFAKEPRNKHAKQQSTLMRVPQHMIDTSVAIEYGDYAFVEVSNHSNPNCKVHEYDMWAKEKFEIRTNIIKHIQETKKYPFDSGILSLWNVRVYFPAIVGRFLIPEWYMDEMLWIYGKTGVRIIEIKLKNSTTNSLNAKNKKQIGKNNISNSSLGAEDHTQTS